MFNSTWHMAWKVVYCGQLIHDLHVKLQTFPRLTRNYYYIFLRTVLWLNGDVFTLKRPPATGQNMLSSHT